MAITLDGSNGITSSNRIDTQTGFRQLNGTTQTAGIFPERVITGAGTSDDLCIFTETGYDLHVMTGGTIDKKLSVDSAGRVTMPYQPGFRSGTWTFDSNGYGLNYASASGNSGGMSFNYRNSGHFNTTTGRFTAPVSGKYLIQATYADDNAVENRSIGHLFINGSGRGEWVESWGQYDNTSNCIIEYLNAGDYVQFGRHPGIPYSGLVASIDLLG